MPNAPQARTVWSARALMALLSLPIPLTLFWLSLHKPGIALSSATSGDLSEEAYSQFFIGTGQVVTGFWAAITRGFVFATISSLIGILISIAQSFLWLFGRGHQPQN
jgi:hypothetical protein